MTTEERPERAQEESTPTKRRSRMLIVLGILLLGVASACALRVAAGWGEFGPHPDEAVMYGFGIAVTGLSGLVCGALGFVRLLSREKGPK